jgi:hypothetical protein
MLGPYIELNSGLDHIGSKSRVRLLGAKIHDRLLEMQKVYHLPPPEGFLAFLDSHQEPQMRNLESQ